MTNKIFVSIASFRDPDCPKTIESLFTNASYPLNIYIGVCQQNAENDLDCLSGVEKKYLNNIRVSRIPDTHAKGPTYARYICSSLWNNEEYYLQIDSHLLFVKKWDEKLINMLNNLKKNGVKKPIITHYPRDIVDYNNYDTKSNERFNVSTICKSSFNDDSVLIFNDTQLINTNGQLYENAYIAAGLFFCESYFLKQIPFDPSLDYLFFGEEILLSVRFWTNGWRIFTPAENIAYHDYHREKRPTFWMHQRYSNENALDKVRKIIGIVDSKEKYDKYGLGNEKTLQEYYEFAGIDLPQRKIYKNFCNAYANTKISESESENEPNNYSVIYIMIFMLLCVLICLVLIFIYES